MAKLITVKFSGVSGNRYAFAAYPLETVSESTLAAQLQKTVFDKSFSGVFVVTRRRQGKSKAGFVHKRICTGQSDGVCQLLTAQEQSLSAKGANCICLHAEKDKAARQQIEQNLLKGPAAGIA